MNSHKCFIIYIFLLFNNNEKIYTYYVHHHDFYFFGTIFNYFSDVLDLQILLFHLRFKIKIHQKSDGVRLRFFFFIIHICLFY